MEGERLTTLEQALAELQAKDANTQHKLDILISHIPQSENPIPSTQITSVTPKAGRAAKWSACVFRWEEQPENIGYHKFVDWEDFRDEFKREFCPVYADSVAIN